MDAPTKALIEVIGDTGFTVQLHAAGGQDIVEAVSQRTGEAFVVRGDDLYTAVVELAQQVGIQLEDGLAFHQGYSRDAAGQFRCQRLIVPCSSLGIGNGAGLTVLPAT